MRPGQQRRLRISISTLGGEENGGYLPLHLEDIDSVSIGSIIVIEGKNDEKDQKQLLLLDSYQEIDLFRLRKCWNDLLLKREEYLQKEIRALNDKANNNNFDFSNFDEFENVERENSLLLAWIELIEERNAISLPSIEGIPGAFVDSLTFSTKQMLTLEGFERHCPLIFLGKEG